MRKRRRFRPPRFNTVIGKDTVIRGDVEFSGGLHIDGRVEGNVYSRVQDEQATLTVSEVGLIRGDVRVTNVIMNGMVLGDVEATGRVELAENARVTGRVRYRLLEMAMGAEVNGELLHADDEKDENTKPDSSTAKAAEPGENKPVEPVSSPPAAAADKLD